MEEELRALLRDAPNVADLCGDRVNFGSHPQGKPFPAIVLNVFGDGEGHTLKGRDGLAIERVQVDCYGETYGAAKLLSRAVSDLLDGYRGGGFRGVFKLNSRDGREGGSNEAERPFFVKIDFKTNWRA